jgi:import inner membrane translocase subunit TIM50
MINRFYYEKQKEKGGPSTKALLGVLGGFLTVGVGVVWHYGGLEEGQEDLYRNVFPVLAHLYRFRDNLHDVQESFAEPSREILLPDPLPEPYIQPKYTLVIELTDVLAHPNYDRTSGWRWQKRPGLVPFLKALTYPKFEIVLYTHEIGHNAAPIIEAIDPEGDIMYRLFRDSTQYKNGTHVKDLSKLNRDLRKVILLDVDGRASMLQPRNSLVLKKWEGDTGDISLVELIPFFTSILQSNVDDVREVLDYYRDEDDPVAAFRRRQDEYRKQLEEMQQQNAQQQQRRSLFGGFKWR